MKSLILELSGKKIKIEVEKEAFVLSEDLGVEVPVKEKEYNSTTRTEKKKRNKSVYDKKFEGLTYEMKEINGEMKRVRTREYADFMNERARFFRNSKKSSSKGSERALKAWETRRKRQADEGEYDGLVKLNQLEVKEPLPVEIQSEA